MLPCYISPSFPVNGCQGPIENGGQCEARTYDHYCIEQGALLFECPRITSNDELPEVNWTHNLSLGPQWGLSSTYTIMSGDFGLNRDGHVKRQAAFLNHSGGFDVKCKVCGLMIINVQDMDVRFGHYEARLLWGPNTLDYVINETGIQGYALYFVDACHTKIGERLFYHRRHVGSPDEGLTITGPCDQACHHSAYHAFVSGEWPNTTEDVRFMVVPVLDNGYELPIGTTSDVFTDYWTTTTSTTTISSTSSTNSTTTTSATSSTSTTTDPPSVVSGYVGVVLDCSLARGYIADPDVIEVWHVSISKLTGAERRNTFCDLAVSCDPSATPSVPPRLLFVSSSDEKATDSSETTPTIHGQLQGNQTIAGDTRSNDMTQNVSRRLQGVQSIAVTPSVIVTYRIIFEWAGDAHNPGSNGSLALVDDRIWHARDALNSPNVEVALFQIVSNESHSFGVSAAYAAFTIRQVVLANVSTIALWPTTTTTAGLPPCIVLKNEQRQTESYVEVHIMVAVAGTFVVIGGIIFLVKYAASSNQLREREFSVEGDFDENANSVTAPEAWPAEAGVVSCSDEHCSVVHNTPRDSVLCIDALSFEEHDKEDLFGI